MTTANEPSVAELVDEYRDAVRSTTSSYEHGHGYLGEADERAARKELIAALTRLERRCAEMERALRQVSRYDLDGTCGGESGYCREGLTRDDSGDWVPYSEIAALLSPERANEGTKS